jgi:hypothetical protein
MGSIFVLSLSAAANPTLLAAVALMLTRPRPKPMLLAFLVGALLISVTCGLLLVFLFAGTRTASTAKHTVSPIVDITLGALILGITFWVASGRDQRLRAWRDRRREKAKDKPPPRWRRTIENGSPWTAFVLGIALSLPGAEYVASMDILSKQGVAIGVTVLVVVAFNAVQLLILEIPLLGYMVKPQSTEAAVERFTDWIRRHGHRLAVIVAVAIGVALILLGSFNL